MSNLPVIGSLGAGRMGRGIAHAFAFAGHEVVLIDAKARAAAEVEALRAQAFAEIRASLTALAEAGGFDAKEIDAMLKRVRFAFAGHEVVLIDAKARAAAEVEALRTQAFAEIRASLVALAEAGGFDAKEIDAMLARVRFVARDGATAELPGVDVLFEGVPEVLEAKSAAFGFAVPHLRADAIVASTTSTMLSTELAGFAARPERFLNCHWLNPAYLIPLVELSPHAGTAGAVTARLKAILEAIGKKPVVCKAAPGFIVPRLQALVMNEAARMVEQGIATAEDVDRAVRYGFGPRYASMGVVEFIDYGGLDILYYASHYLAKALGEPRFEPPEIVNRYMHEGRRGLRDGKGFFDWGAVDAPAYRKEVLARQLALLRHLGLAPEPGAALRARSAAPR